MNVDNIYGTLYSPQVFKFYRTLYSPHKVIDIYGTLYSPQVLNFSGTMSFNFPLTGLLVKFMIYDDLY